MFVKNAWYCAGWDYDVSQGKNVLVSRLIAGEHVVLYRKPDGVVVAMEDRCPHRQAPLSLGRKEGDSLRCLYHGMIFAADGQCTEIPGQSVIPPAACVRVFPVVEKDSWIWVWMGDPAKADPSLICFSVGPDNRDWNIKTSHMQVNANYRLEIANLMDLSHLTWVHRTSLGGTMKYTEAGAKHEINARGVDTKFWVRQVPVPFFSQHLFPEGTLFDLHFHVEMTIPCNFILHFRVFLAGTATEGPSDGQLVLDTYSCQAITPRDEDSVDYYYSWGASRETDSPGMSDMLREALDVAFLEDKEILEGQWQRLKQRGPEGNKVNIIHDTGPGKLLHVLDTLLKAEAPPAARQKSAAQ